MIKIVIQSIIKLATLYIHRYCQTLGEKQETKNPKIFIVLATIICNNYIPRKGCANWLLGRPIKTSDKFIGTTSHLSVLILNMLGKKSIPYC